VARTSVDPGKLYAALDAARIEQGSGSWRSLANKVGVSPSLLSRIANGQKPDADGFATIVRWLGVPAEDFFTADDDDSIQTPSLTAQLAPLLRAQKDLSEADVKYLEQLIQTTLEHVRNR
jgi:transcriptional regulator with XRE-family HTH domain